MGGKDSFCYLGDVISCGGWVELAVRDRISCAWSKWRVLVNYLVNHNIPLRERAKVCCACVRSVLLYAVETLEVTKRLEALLKC